MLFAMFFGAGNLIFPPKLGYESGSVHLLATIGFFITGIGLPLISVVVASLAEGGFQKALSKINSVYNNQLEWILFAVIGYVIGYFVGMEKQKIDFGATEMIK